MLSETISLLYSPLYCFHSQGESSQRLKAHTPGSRIVSLFCCCLYLQYHGIGFWLHQTDLDHVTCLSNHIALRKLKFVWLCLDLRVQPIASNFTQNTQIDSGNQLCKGIVIIIKEKLAPKQVYIPHQKKKDFLTSIQKIGYHCLGQNWMVDHQKLRKEMCIQLSKNCLWEVNTDIQQYKIKN